MFNDDRGENERALLLDSYWPGNSHITETEIIHTSVDNYKRAGRPVAWTIREFKIAYWHLNVAKRSTRVQIKQLAQTKIITASYSGMDTLLRCKKGEWLGGCAQWVAGLLTDSLMFRLLSVQYWLYLSMVCYRLCRDIQISIYVFGQCRYVMPAVRLKLN